MKYRYKYLVVLVLSIFFLVSCEKIKLETMNNDIAVVESYLIPNQPIKIKVWKQLLFDSEDTVANMISGLELKIYNGIEWFDLTEVDNGIYSTDQFYPIEDSNYHLEFNYNSSVISSETSIPSKPEGFTTSASTIEVNTSFGMGGGIPFTPIVLSWYNPDVEYHMVVVENIEMNPALIDPVAERPVRSFRNTPTYAESQDLNPRSFTYFGRHRVILFKLNPEYAALYEQLGTSSLDIVAPPSNIKNGLGVFTGINADTLYVNVKAY